MSDPYEERLEAFLYNLSSDDLLRVYNSGSSRSQDDVDIESRKDLR